MANELDQRFILVENDQYLRAKKSNGTEGAIVKLNASDKAEFEVAPVVGGSELTTETVVDAKVLVETQRALASEVAIQANVDSEEASRISGDAATLASAEAFTVSQISSEVTSRINGDSSTLASANAYTDSGIGAEANQRQLGDAATLLSANTYTDSQISIAQGDVSAVEAALAQELLDRAAADAALQLQIDSVLSNVDGTALNSLAEIVTAFQAADSSLNGAITSLSSGLSADIQAEEDARIAADSALQAEIDAAEASLALIQNTPKNQIIYVSKNGSDAVGVGFGSDLKPVLTATRANALITDATDTKRYIVAFGPGSFVEAAGFEFKANVTYLHLGSRGSCSLSVASGNIVWNAPDTANAKVNLQNIAIFSPIVINQNNAVNIGAIEAYHLYTTGAITINNIGAAQFSSQIRYSRLGAITTSGNVAGNLEFSTHGAVTHGSSSATTAQGSLFRRASSTSGLVAVTVNAASYYAYNAYADTHVIHDRGVVSAKDLVYTADCIRSGGLTVTGTFTTFKLSDIVNSVYVPATAGNWTVTPAEAKSALDELASRLKTNETLDIAQTARLDAIEAVAFVKEKKVVDATVASSKTFTLGFTPKASSLSVFIGRLALHQGDDYTLSGAVVTFIGTIAGASGIKTGDNLYFTYSK